MPTYEIRPLRETDVRDTFRSGNPDLDRFFHKYAGQNQFRHHIGTTYVALNQGIIVGFATVSAAQIEVEALPNKARRRLPHYPLPVLRLARLAVDERAKGQGVGGVLLQTVFQLSHEMARRVGCVGVVVDAKPEAVVFYERFGFEALEAVQGQLGDRPEPLAMFLSLAEIPQHDDPA